MRSALLILSIFVFSPIGSAQEAKQAATPAAAPSATPVPADPQTTSATYGDWVLVCQRTAAATPERLCEISQSVQVQGQPGPIAQIAITKGEDTPGVTVVLPPNITLGEGPRILIDEKDTQAVSLAWVRCLPGGCFATATLKDEVLGKWRPLDDRGRLEFKDGMGRTIAVPFSFRGLGVAYDALGKQG